MPQDDLEDRTPRRRRSLGRTGKEGVMTAGLYDTDTLTWAEQQAAQ